MILNLEAGSLFTGSIEKNQRYTVIVVLSTSNELTLHYMYNTKNKCSIRICRVSFFVFQAYVHRHENTKILCRSKGKGNIETII